jgi:hypothetical protein
MNNIIEDNDGDQFANGQSSRDLRVSSDAAEPPPQLDLNYPRERSDSSDGLQALRKNSGEDLDRRIELPDGAEGEFGTSGGSSMVPSHNQTSSIGSVAGSRVGCGFALRMELPAILRIH